MDILDSFGLVGHQMVAQLEGQQHSPMNLMDMPEALIEVPLLRN
jgi:hypothetical protein